VAANFGTTKVSSAELSADEAFMRVALAAAQVAADADEVPVGAVLVFDNEIIAVGHNRTELDHDPTAHAEVVALRMAAKAFRNVRLLETTLYVTVEPCAMCAGALIWSRVKRLVYGTPDHRAGAIDSVFQLAHNAALNHQLSVTAGVLGSECQTLMQRFFRQKRAWQRATTL
jgi:tRNA(adenine34) deaminase